MTHSVIASIQGEQRNASSVSPGIKCKGTMRHTGLDGNVYVENHNGVEFWVARLQCDCGVKRVTRYVPRTWEQVGAHDYDYTEAKDYPTDLSREECRIKVLDSMLELKVN